MPLRRWLTASRYAAGLGVMSRSMVSSSTRFSATSVMYESGVKSRRNSRSMIAIRSTLAVEITVWTPKTM